jgi:hypothetical protein
MLVDRVTFREAEAIVPDYEGPEAYQFRKPGYSVWHPVERYHLKQSSAASSSDAAAQPLLSSQQSEQDDDEPEKRVGPEVFVSYSHQDSTWLKQLKEHLAPFIAGDSLSVWDDEKIQAGARWATEIEQALERAQAAILLVTPHFLSSTFITGTELPTLLTAVEERGMVVLWVPISASSYHKTAIEQYQAASDPGRPIDTLTQAEQNQIWVDICRRIEEALQG